VQVFKCKLDGRDFGPGHYVSFSGCTGTAGRSRRRNARARACAAAASPCWVGISSRHVGAGAGRRRFQGICMTSAFPTCRGLSRFVDAAPLFRKPLFPMPQTLAAGAPTTTTTKRRPRSGSSQPWPHQRSRPRPRPPQQPRQVSRRRQSSPCPSARTCPRSPAVKVCWRVGVWRVG
jgi:hypothetical protein